MLMASLSRPMKFFQPLAESFDARLKPERIELRAQIVLEKVLAHDSLVGTKA
jgi:hypothetical protein